MFVPTWILLLLCVLLWQHCRSEARREKERADAETPNARYMASLQALRVAREALQPWPMPAHVPQPTAWGPTRPWKTEAQYRNALQVAQWDKAQRTA